MRVVQPKGIRGSQKWLQLFVEDRPDLLEAKNLGPIEWRSPRETDGFAEYRDAAFLDLIDCCRYADDLARFWPARGPQWDGLGLTNSGDPVLVEAKAHIGEFLTPETQAGPRSKTKINAALESVKTDLGVSGSADWADTFYQYTNRIAHLWFLHSMGVPAHLLFVSFLNDEDMQGPTQVETWEAAFRTANYALGLPRAHKLRQWIHHVSPDVAKIGNP